MKLLFFILLINRSLASDCFNNIIVESTSQKFIANMLFPRIENYTQTISIKVSCEFYKKLKNGTIIQLEDIKKFNDEKILNIIPQGTINRTQFKVQGL